MAKPGKPAGKRSGLTASDLYEQLRQMAILYKLRPGERVNELELSQAFNTSRSPVREALNRLASEKFLTFVPNRGFYGRELDRQDIYNLYELRKCLETAAVALAIDRAADADILAVRTFWSEVMRKSGRIPTQRLVALDEEFHVRVVALSRNDELVRALEGVNARIHFVRWVDMEERQSDLYGEHQSLVDALLKRDLRRCHAILDGHISRRMEEIVQVIQAGVVRLYAP